MDSFLDRQFAAQRGLLAGADEVVERKRHAYEQFAARGFPTRKDEDFRYTDLKRLAATEYELATARPAPALRRRVAAKIAEAGLPHDGPRCVFIDGHLDAELSELAGARGIELEPLGANPGELQNADAHHPHPLANFNAAFTEQGLLIKATERHAAGPLALVFVGSEKSEHAPQPRLLIELAADAALTVVQHFIDLEPGGAWLNLVTEIRQARGSRLELYRVQEHAAERVHTSLLRAHLAHNAHLTAGYVDLGGQLVRNDLDVQLAEPGAAAALFGVFFASDGQHIDNHLRVEHIAADTRSEESFRGIVGERGHGVFNGKVVVHENAQRIDAQQSSDNLLLADNAEIDTKPELEIYADDVKCSHGATIGELDEKQLFYLRSRGIDEDAARGLLTFAFANTVLERFGIAGLRDRVAAHLPDHEQWEGLA